MLLTLVYMIATIMQTRTMTYLKAHLRAILKGNKSSIMLYNKPFQHLNKDYNGTKSSLKDEHEENDYFMSSRLCLNKSLATLGELLWYKGNVKLCSIYPQQQVDISDWLMYPYGISSFPVYMNNCCQTLNTTDFKVYVLVEAELETYKLQASTILTKLENYGLVTTWKANKNLNFIMETDIDLITSFIIAVIQGQCYINNGLLLTRIQSVLVSGMPRICDSEQFNQSLDEKFIGKTQWDLYVQKLRALSNDTQITMQQNESAEITVLSDASVHLPNQSNTEITEYSTPTSHLTPADVKNDTEPTVTLANANTISVKQVPTITNTAKDFDNLVKLRLSHATKKKDNTLFDADNEIVTKSIFQNKPTEGTINLKSASTHSALEEEKKYIKIAKPPNILIYADSPDGMNNVKTVLKKALDPNRYVIYTLTKDEARSNAWMDQVALVIICGNVDSEIGGQFVEYVIRGGKLLALCSDMLHTLLPSFKTAEVRESELVHFSYGKWKHVRMMHHIFCYHASPVRTRFSQDHEEIRTPVLNPPASTSVKDKRGILHSFDVKVLGTEETWHNPSILLATIANSGGKVVFSQIHLEVDPMQYEYEEDKFNALKESNTARLEIIRDLLSVHLGMEVNHVITQTSITYTPAYFLGKFEMKVKILEKLKSDMQSNDILKMPNLDMRFYTGNTITQSASNCFLPVMVHMCPPNFSTVKYFENLATKQLGRLVIYADVLASSMNVTQRRLQHGLAVIPRQQTQGQGRGRNEWLSPLGCAMFTLQIHISTNSILGKHISILQHIVGVALVSAVRSIPGYEDIEIGLKWPNDIYINSSTKIGGLLVHTQIEGSLCICNIGAGVNLSNSKPTSCINDMILKYNQKHGTKLQTFLYEQYLALVFNKLENLLDIVQDGNMEHFFKFYYRYWLHTNSSVTVIASNGKAENVKILGIDDFGFLSVQAKKGAIFSVHPDGNSFDLLKGLIAPK